MCSPCASSKSNSPVSSANTATSATAPGLRGHPAVRHVEDDAALARLADLAPHLSRVVHDPVAATVEEVAHDVARAQEREELAERHGRVGAVDHDATAERVGGAHRAP